MTTPRSAGTIAAVLNAAVKRQRKQRGAAPNRGPRQAVPGSTSVSTPPTRSTPG